MNKNIISKKNIIPLLLIIFGIILIISGLIILRNLFKYAKKEKNSKYITIKTFYSTISIVCGIFMAGYGQTYIVY